MTSSQEQPRWLHQVEEPPPTPPRFEREPELGKAWQRLQVLHTPSRTAEAEEYRWIVDWLADLERLFLERPDLDAYYQECFEAEKGGTPPPRPVPPPQPGERSAEVNHVATIQAQFMEEVFYTMSLDRHANAMDNRGWMNLFRRWGRSPRFNARLDELRSVLTLQFLSFYDLYLRYYPQRIDEEPVPHPWDSPVRRKDPRGPGAIPVRTGGISGPVRPEDEPSITRERPAAVAQPEEATLPGIYLDSGIREAGTLPPSQIEQMVPQPGSARADPQEGGDQIGRAQPGDESGESGGSAPSVPNR